MSVEAPDLLDMLADLEAERWECGLHRRGAAYWNDLMEHGVECWGNACPHCGMTFTYPLEVLNHDPYGRHVEQFGTCWPQRWMFEREACCMACRWPTFGVWPCRNERCPSLGPAVGVDMERVA